MPADPWKEENEMSFVYLRVVGIYARITVPMFGPVRIRTVADLVKAAAVVDTNFTYQLNSPTPHGGLSLLTASYNWRISPPTLSGAPRPPGLYSITENLRLSPAGIVTAWQYYIERPHPTDPSYRTLVSKTPIGGGFKLLNQSEPLQANDEVIFRCVALDLKPA
jgi:hypothetical protein